MRSLDITWEHGVKDTTGLLFSYAKALGTSVKNSPYSEIAEDVIATSGFAFRMWVDEQQLSASVMSKWELDGQKIWVENSGLKCDYVGCRIEDNNSPKEIKMEAVTIIETSINQGIPAVAWNIEGCEWGLITGYDKEKECFSILSITGNQNRMSYDLLGIGEHPYLSVLTLTGKSEKSQEDILKDTLKMAAGHLMGEEHSEYKTGLEAYPAFLRFFEEDSVDNLDWNREYYLGTYTGLKYYAYQYFIKQEMSVLAELYQRVYENWKKSFDLKRAHVGMNESTRNQIRELLKEAYEAEKVAVEFMKNEGRTKDA